MTSQCHSHVYEETTTRRILASIDDKTVERRSSVQVVSSLWPRLNQDMCVHLQSDRLISSQSGLKKRKRPDTQESRVLKKKSPVASLALGTLVWEGGRPKDFRRFCLSHCCHLWRHDPKGMLWVFIGSDRCSMADWLDDWLLMIVVDDQIEKRRNEKKRTVHWTKIYQNLCRLLLYLVDHQIESFAIVQKNSRTLVLSCILMYIFVSSQWSMQTNGW